MDPKLPERLRAAIRNVPDFPKPGILFRDITTFLVRPDLLREAVEAMGERFAGRFDMVAGIESRGFILGAPLAVARGVPFVPLRKPGKLPAAVYRESYDLEYGTDALEVHRDAFAPGARVLIVDDLLATGGTAVASARLVETAGAVVAGLSFLVELEFLPGRARLADREVFSLVRYAGEE
jgi:adenine phosphoribosyltransferase